MKSWSSLSDSLIVSWDIRDLAIQQIDSDKILQMFINLLDNAIKYNLPSNGQIWLALQKVGENIELSISNTGVTIPKDSLVKIFEQF